MFFFGSTLSRDFSSRMLKLYIVDIVMRLDSILKLFSLFGKSFSPKTSFPGSRWKLRNFSQHVPRFVVFDMCTSFSSWERQIKKKHSHLKKQKNARKNCFFFPFVHIKKFSHSVVDTETTQVYDYLGLAEFRPKNIREGLQQQQRNFRSYGDFSVKIKFPSVCALKSNKPELKVSATESKKTHMSLFHYQLQEFTPVL